MYVVTLPGLGLRRADCSVNSAELHHENTAGNQGDAEGRDPGERFFEENTAGDRGQGYADRCPDSVGDSDRHAGTESESEHREGQYIRDHHGSDPSWPAPCGHSKAECSGDLEEDRADEEQVGHLTALGRRACCAPYSCSAQSRDQWPSPSAQGAFWADGKSVGEVPTEPITHAVDSTGAGDAFAGALAAELLAGTNLAEATKTAVRVRTFSVQRVGAQNSYPTREDINA